MNIKKEKICLILLLISIFISIISQIPIYNDILSKMNIVLWLVTILSYLLTKNKSINFSKNDVIFILISFVMILYNLSMILFGFYEKLPNMLRVVLLPLVVYLVGTNVDKKDINKIDKVFVFSAIILAIWINFNYFNSITAWLNSNAYLYGSKNSAAQIFATAIILLISNLKEKKVIKIILALYLFLIICLMQCRTSIVSLAFALVIFAYVKSKHKIKLSFILFIILLISIKIPLINNFISHALFIDKYANSSLNTFSSGRFALYYNTILTIKDNLLLGTGNYYVDNLFLNLLSNFGLIFGGMYILFIIFIFIKNVWNNKCDEHYKKVLYYLTFYYMVTSFLEGFPPYGPGTCTLIFWIFTGIYFNAKNNRFTMGDKKWQKV